VLKHEQGKCIHSKIENGDWWISSLEVQCSQLTSDKKEEEENVIYRRMWPKAARKKTFRIVKRSSSEQHPGLVQKQSTDDDK